MKTVKSVLHQMAVDAWGAGTITLVLCLALEGVERGFVSRFFNLLWLLLFVIASSIAVMATHTSVAADDAIHRSAGSAQALLRLGSVLLAVAAWFLLPESLHLWWRAIAAGSILLASLTAWSTFAKHD